MPTLSEYAIMTCRKVSYRYTTQELVLSEFEYLQDLGDTLISKRRAYFSTTP